MAGARFTKEGVEFEPGYSPPRPLRLVFRLANRHRWMRVLVIHQLPHSRLRTALAGIYYHWMFGHFLDGRTDQVIEVFAADGEWEMFDGLETFRGRAGYLQLWEEMLGAFGDMTGELSEFIVAGDARFAAVVRSRAPGGQSGIELEQFGAELTALADVANGDAVRVRVCRTREEALALAAVG
jgi:hypothetical protein